MVNLISNEPKTGCYLLPILSNLQAPIFKCLEMNRLQHHFSASSTPSIRSPLSPKSTSPIRPLELLICIFPPHAAC
jgi:hypothetical protein